MSKNEYVEGLLQKFINDTISKSEFETLFKYINVLDSEEEIKNLMTKHWEKINEDTYSKDYKNDELLDTILEKINNKKPARKLPLVKHLFKLSGFIAAILTISFSVGYFYNHSNISDSNTELKINPLPVEAITLKLDNGEVKIISEKEQQQIVNANGLVVAAHKGNTIAYQNNISDEKLVYNTLTVPYGKRFHVVLSDGTKVHLNAGTSLKYPVKFINGLNREVFLDGEAFFDVTKDIKHPFLVNSNNLNVKVLGTKFNVASYPEDTLINTVLIEGSVEVFQKENDSNLKTASILKPGFKASWHKDLEKIDIKKVNTEQYTAWMDGRLILDEVTFKNIQKKLERQYNVTFINNNETLKQRKFTARFDIENIDQVMKSLSISASFNYTLNNNQIIIY